MATRDTVTDDRGLDLSRASSARVTRDETKPSFMTTEFYAMVGAIAAILVAAAQADNFDAPRAWARCRGRDRLHDQQGAREIR